MPYPPQGTITRAELNSVEADLAAHGIATTAIHGVGALHIAGFHSVGQEVSKVIWKDESEMALELVNQSTDVAWTELDLTAFTSANAKFAILQLMIGVDSITAGASNWARLAVRKNGTTPYVYPLLGIDGEWAVAGMYYYSQAVIVDMASGQLIDYCLQHNGTARVDLDIDVLGYIE